MHNLKLELSQITEHMRDNPQTLAGRAMAPKILLISPEVYRLKLLNLPYNQQIEFKMACDPRSLTHLFTTLAPPPLIEGGEV